MPSTARSVSIQVSVGSGSPAQRRGQRVDGVHGRLVALPAGPELPRRGRVVQEHRRPHVGRRPGERLGEVDHALAQPLQRVDLGAALGLDRVRLDVASPRTSAAAQRCTMPWCATRCAPSSPGRSAPARSPARSAYRTNARPRRADPRGAGSGSRRWGMPTPTQRRSRPGASHLTDPAARDISPGRASSGTQGRPRVAANPSPHPSGTGAFRP